MRKLWNRAPFPVWSLSTIDSQGKGNMNICAYVTSVSMQPKMMILAIYHHTKTMSNVKNNHRALLQLLTHDHIDIVHLCGRQSGTATDKISRIEKKHELSYKNDIPYLKDCAGYMELEFTDFLEVGGDHLLAVATVISSKNLADTEILTTEYLKEKGIIR